MRACGSEHIIVRELSAFLAELELAGPPEFFISYYLELRDILLGDLLLSGLSHQSPAVILRILNGLSALGHLDQQDGIRSDLAERYSMLTELYGRALQDVQGSGARERILYLTDSEICLSLPVVEKCQMQDRTLSAGMLETLSIEIEKRNSRSGDRFLFGSHPLDRDSEILLQARHALYAGRTWVERHHRSKRSDYFLQFTYSRDYMRYSGQSFGLALALGLSVLLQNRESVRESVQLREGLAVTGLVSPDGSILPVSEDSLREKIWAVFHSDTEILIIPKANEDPCRMILRDLQTDCPERSLKIIPAEHLHELLRSDQIIRSRPKSHARQIQTLRQKYSSRIRLLSFILFLLMVLILFPMDPRALSVEFSGGGLQAYNRAGRKTWFHAFASAGNSAGFSTLSEKGKLRLKRKLSISDLDRDGRMETVYEAAELEADKQGIISCLDDLGRVLWTYSASDSVHWSNGYSYHPPFLLTFLKADTVMQSGIMAVFRHNTYFPAKIVHLSAEGERLAEYRHGGHINDALWTDIDGDGQAEILFAGLHNGHNRPVIGILQPLQDTVSSTLTASETVLGFRLLRYALLPRLDWLKIGPESHRYAVSDIRCLGPERLMLTIFGGNFYERSATLELNTDFECLGFNIPDHILSNYLQEHGRAFWDDHSPAEIRAKMFDVTVLPAP